MRNAITTILYGILVCLCFANFLHAQERGIASYYSDSFQGRKTASGEKYDKNLLTGAHKTLPFGTIVKVTRIDNGQSVKVRINDLGPYISGRIIDLSGKAGEVLGLKDDGVAEVEIAVVGKSNTSPTVRDNAGFTTKSTTPSNTLPPTPELKNTAPAKSSTSKASGAKTTDNKLVEKGEAPSTKNKSTNKAPSRNQPNPESYEKPIEIDVPPVKDQPTSKKSTAKAAASSKPASSTNGSSKRSEQTGDIELEKATHFKPGKTYKVDISIPKERLYGVQVAAVKDINSMMLLVTKYQGMWFDDVFVHFETVDDTPIYKIILGAFDEREKADSYKRSLKKRKKITGFVVEM